MLLHLLADAEDTRCQLTYDEPHGWLRATWRGHVISLRALHAMGTCLNTAASYHCPCLLNDNLALVGSWFDSLDWLTYAWSGLHLRYMTHVVPAYAGTDLLLSCPAPRPLCRTGELQLFFYH